MFSFTIRMYRPDHLDKDLVLPFLLSLNAPPMAVPGFGLGEYIFSAWRDLDPPTTETLALALDDSGALLALCWLEKPNELAISVAPRIEATPIEAALYRELIEFGVSRLKVLAPDNTEPIGITIGWANQNEARYLTDLGMVTEGDIRHYTYRWLAGQPMDRSPLPEGFRFVTIEDDARIPKRIEVFLAVWPDSTIDLDRYRNLRSAPYYRTDFDLCVESPDGKLVAFALGWFDPVGKSCQFEPIGCHPDIRGKGIGRSLVQEATHRAIDLGCNRAYINCYAKNDAGNALYRSAGYDLVGRWQWWSFPKEKTT